MHIVHKTAVNEATSDVAVLSHDDASLITLLAERGVIADSSTGAIMLALIREWGIDASRITEFFANRPVGFLVSEILIANAAARAAASRMLIAMPSATSGFTALVTNKTRLAYFVQMPLWADFLIERPGFGNLIMISNGQAHVAHVMGLSEDSATVQNITPVPNVALLEVAARFVALSSGSLLEEGEVLDVPPWLSAMCDPPRDITFVS